MCGSASEGWRVESEQGQGKARQSTNSFRNAMAPLPEERADALEFENDYAKGGAAVPAAEMPADVTRGESEWALGDDEWPVSRRVLESFLTEHGPDRTDGVAKRMQHVRWQLRDLLLAKEEGAIPQSASFTHKSSCCELHPGLCITRDSAIFDIAVLMASHMESFFTDDGLGSFFGLG